jgi:4-aminobutyrate aminotransferase
VAGLWRDRIVELAFERGLLILGCGETSIRLAPPLIVNEHEAVIALDIFEECISLVEEENAR